MGKHACRHMVTHPSCFLYLLKITKRLEDSRILLARSFLLVGANCFAREKKKIFWQLNKNRGAMLLKSSWSFFNTNFAYFYFPFEARILCAAIICCCAYLCEVKEGTLKASHTSSEANLLFIFSFLKDTNKLCAAIIPCIPCIPCWAYFSRSLVLRNKTKKRYEYLFFAQPCFLYLLKGKEGFEGCAEHVSFLGCCLVFLLGKNKRRSYLFFEEIREVCEAFIPPSLRIPNLG